jgi:hypothetical protein
MFTRHSCRPLIAAALVFLQMQVGRAQPPAGAQPPLSTAAAGVKTQVDALPIGGKLTVTMLDGSEYHGHLRSIEADSFSMREVDLKRVLTLRYEEVKRVQKDFGRPGFGGKRVNPRTNRIAGILILGALLGIVFGVLAAAKS